MHLDVVALNKFYYRTKLGRFTKMRLNDAILGLWGEALGQRLVGFGFAAPLLSSFIGKAEEMFCLMPGQQGVIAWPNKSDNVSVLIEETSWPIANESIDRLIILHGLETCDKPKELLQEIWRVLAPSAKVIFVVPNRSGLWARSELTPFGFGRPYSLGQLEEQLEKNRFEVIRYSYALYAPPSEKIYWLKTLKFWEALGQRLDSRVMAGAIIVEASKQSYALPESGVKDSIGRPLNILDGFVKPRSGSIASK